jgi:hypothetical protein
MSDNLTANDLTGSEKMELVDLIGTWLRKHGYLVYDIAEASVDFYNKKDDHESLCAMVAVKLKGSYTYPTFKISKANQKFSIAKEE